MRRGARSQMSRVAVVERCNWLASSWETILTEALRGLRLSWWKRPSRPSRWCLSRPCRTRRNMPRSLPWKTRLICSSLRGCTLPTSWSHFFESSKLFLSYSIQMSSTNILIIASMSVDVITLNAASRVKSSSLKKDLVPSKWTRKFSCNHALFVRKKCQTRILQTSCFRTVSSQF